MKILCLSDIHLKQRDSIEAKRLIQAIRDSSSDMKVIDAVFVIGDFTENGSDLEYQIFEDIISSELSKETKLVVSLGNHENMRKESNSHQKFYDLFSYPASNVFDINGYKVITLSTGKDEKISTQMLKWLDEKLKLAHEYDSKKPIFFLHHYPAFDEVPYSVMGGQPILFDLLKHYPNVIHISGHTHPDLKDERILSLEPFISYNNGSLSWQIYRDELFVKKENRKRAGQYSVIEIDDSNQMVIYRYEIEDESKKSIKIGEMRIYWTIG